MTRKYQRNGDKNKEKSDKRCEVGLTRKVLYLDEYSGDEILFIKKVPKEIRQLSPPPLQYSYPFISWE